MHARLAALGLLSIVALAPAAVVAEPVAGSKASFAERGVVILWAVLRGVDEATTEVVVRVLPEDLTLTAFAVDIADRSGGRQEAVAAPAALPLWAEVRVARSRLSERPRTEVHFARKLEDLPRQPALTVVFTDVPAGAPELTTEAALSAHFANALARVRARRATPR